MTENTERPIFVDPTGRRRRLSLSLLCIFFIAIVAGCFVLIPPALGSHNVTGVSTQSRAESPEAIASAIDRRNVPILGTGPLVRVVRLQTTNAGIIATDPYKTSPTFKLGEQDAQLASGYEYAIVRYGQTATKRIALTFDDGPDSIYTPQILDELSKSNAQSTFFVTGANVLKHPDIVARMVREGHTLGNHSFSHPNFLYKGEARDFQEINQTDHVIRAVANRQTPFFRPPYVGMDDQELRNNVAALLESQKQGYITTLYTYDTKDWAIKNGKLPPLPAFDGSDVVLLMHDSGGNRSATVKYVGLLLDEAKKHGYTFANLDQLFRARGTASTAVAPTIGDTASRAFFSAALVWPHQLIRVLFYVTVALVSVTLLVNFTLALFENRRVKQYKRRASRYTPSVSVIIPAYNEQKVLAKTVRSVLRSRYKAKEIIIIDDGSIDDTFLVAQEMAQVHRQVKCYKKVNGGKSSALNMGLKKAKGEIIICMDADTVFMPTTINRLVRHFKDPEIGCVAGTIKVGNIKNVLTRWQALEYIVCVYVDRSAQAFLNSIMIAPGACSAWRARAIRVAGNYSSSTFAEDCDLTLSLQATRAYKVIQDSSAHAYTEAPLQMGALAKQRFRWIFGNLQAIWKHKNMLFRREYGWLGMYIMPLAVTNILLPILFIPILLLLAVLNLLSGNIAVMLVFVGITLANQFFAALAALLFARERLGLLLAFPVTRLIYSPLKTYLIYRSVLIIAQGASVFWNKLQRTGTVSKQYMRV